MGVGGGGRGVLHHRFMYQSISAELPLHDIPSFAPHPMLAPAKEGALGLAWGKEEGVALGWGVWWGTPLGPALAHSLCLGDTLIPPPGPLGHLRMETEIR